jgi:two-component sensor histidine kinase
MGDIVSNVVAPMCGDQLSFAGPDVKLDPKQTLSLALALQELSTNSHKYGALSNPNGKVQLDWAVTGEPLGPKLRLNWVEDSGFDLKEPTKRGLGTSLLEAILTRAHKTSFAISYPKSGARCEILLPIGHTQADGKLPSA